MLKLDNDNETEIELEEAFMQTTSLPFGLQVKGGQFFAAFGRINPTHPHTWDFADAPLVNGRLLGPDGLRGVGAQLSWTLPVPWYSQLSSRCKTAAAARPIRSVIRATTAFFTVDERPIAKLRGLQDFVWVPRWENSFDLSQTADRARSASPARLGRTKPAPTRARRFTAPISSTNGRARMRRAGFPFVKWQTEAMYRRFEAGRGVDESFPVAETFHDWGMYSQVVWGFQERLGRRRARRLSAHAGLAFHR